MHVDIVSLCISHEILRSRSFNKRHTGDTFVRAKVDVQDRTATDEIDNVFMGCPLRKTFYSDCTLLSSCIERPFGPWRG